MFIAQAFKAKHEFWRYLIGSAIIIVAAVIGQLPLGVVVAYKSFKEGIGMDKLDEKALYSLLEPNLFLFLMLISFVAGMIGLFLVVKYLHKQTILSVTTARKKIDWKRIWFAFFFWGILSSGLVLLDYYMSPEDYVFNFQVERFAILAVIAIALIPIQTSLEEYIFRGYLMQGFAMGTKEKLFPLGFVISLIFIPTWIILNINFDISLLNNTLIIFGLIIFAFLLHQILLRTHALESQAYANLGKSLERKWVPLLITSSIFGLLHLANPEVRTLGYSIMVYYIGTGLFLGILTLMDDGMELALGFHAANNLFTALLVTSDWTAFQTHSILKDVAKPELGFLDLVLPVFVLFPILLFIFSRVYKWTGWKDKLFGEIVEPPLEDYKVLDEIGHFDK